MNFNELTLFLITFAGLFLMVVSYIGVLEGIQKLKQHLAFKKDALKIIGKDAIRYGDKGAKLAYKGIMKYYNEKYIASAEYFERALKLNLDDHNTAFCYEWLAHCYYKLDKPDEYKKIRFRAVQAVPTNDEVLVIYAACLADRGDFKNAEYYYNQAIKYNPNNVNAYRTLGLMEQTRGNYEKALQFLDTALKVCEQDIASIYEKAVCYAAMGEYQKAEELMTRAAAADESNQYEHYKTKIQNILKISEHDLFKEEGSSNS